MTTRSPLARDEYDRAPENSGSDAPQKNGLRHLPRKVVGVLAACVVFVGALLGLYWGGAFEPWLNEYSTTTPACATASSPEDVQQALARTEELNAIRSVAKNVEFSQTLLCDGQKAVLTITYTDRSDFKRLNDAVTSAHLGAAAEIKLKR